MDESHHLDFVVIADQNRMIKIGQYPSVADLDFPELKEYKKVLSEEDMKEMKRAIGLNAQGIGVGSYVYLRRIVERLIYKAQDMAIADGTVKQENIEKLRVVDRIKELKGYLPDMFTSNPTIYGIVSKGIHELSEEECLKELEQLREMRGRIQGCSYGEKIGTNPNRNLEAPFIKTIEKIWDYEQRIDAQINRLVDLRSEINAAIESMENPEERLLLKYRYLKNESWEDISYELNVSYRTVHRIHASSLNNFVVPE